MNALDKFAPTELVRACVISTNRLSLRDIFFVYCVPRVNNIFWIIENMNKARVLQIIAVILIVMGGYLVYLNIENGLNPGILGGIGPIIMGFALIVISRSGSFKS